VTTPSTETTHIATTFAHDPVQVALRSRAPMRIADVDPYLLHGAGAIVGIALGAIAAKGADLLPRRYGITSLVPEARRRWRNAMLVALSTACTLAIAHVLGAVAEMSLAHAGFLLGVHAVVAAMVLTASAIDLEHMILPDELTIGGALLCLATSPLRSVGFTSSISGAALGLLVSYVPFLVYKRLRGRSGMGLGDAKLTALGGAWHGMEGALLILFAGALQLVIAAIVLGLLGKGVKVPPSVTAQVAELERRARGGDEDAANELAADPMAAGPLPGVLGMRLPFGPFLGLASIELLFIRRWLADHAVLGWLRP
jgi:leader peptidase (prepilin peptidase) / N-methyltransferase